MITQKLHTELNPVQVSLLRLFNRPMSENESLALRNLMVNYYSDLLEKEITEVVTEKGYNQQHFDDMLNNED